MNATNWWGNLSEDVKVAVEKTLSAKCTFSVEEAYTFFGKSIK